VTTRRASRSSSRSPFRRPQEVGAEFAIRPRGFLRCGPHPGPSTCHGVRRPEICEERHPGRRVPKSGSGSAVPRRNRPHGIAAGADYLGAEPGLSDRATKPAANPSPSSTCAGRRRISLFPWFAIGESIGERGRRAGSGASVFACVRPS